MVLPVLTIEEVEYEYLHRYESRTQFIYGNMAISLLVATIVVILRFVARRKRGIKLAWNDYTIVLALAGTTTFCAVIAQATKLGLGQHVVIVGKDKGIEVAKMLTIAEMIFPIAGSTIRLSVLMFYVQVFDDNVRWFTIGVRILASQWIAIAFVTLLCTTLQCIPLKLAWSSNHAVGCLNIEKFILTMTIYAIFMNFATLFLPLPLIINLRLNLRKKIAVVALFALAGGDIVLNILRAAYTHEISPNIVNVTWRQVNNSVLAILELNLGIVCACIPTLQPLFTRLANKLGNAIDKAEMKSQILTVPFVLMKSKNGAATSNEPKADLRRAPQMLRKDSLFNGDEEKLIETQLPPYSQISQPRSTWKGLFRKDGSFATWLGSRKDELSEKTLLGTQNSAMSWKPGTPLENEIAKNLMQSGYPKARYSSHGIKDPDKQHDSLYQLPSPPRPTSRPGSKGLNIDTREEIVRPSSKDQQPTRSSPFTGLSGNTYFHSPEVSADPHPGKKIEVAQNDRSVHVLRTLSQRSWKRRPSGPTLNPTKYQPSQSSSAKTPTRERTGKRKGPHYVRSPLTDPDEKIRIGIPREVTIPTPRSGRSVKRKESLPDAQMPKLPKQSLEPHYQRELELENRTSVSESALPSPLQVDGKDLGIAMDGGHPFEPRQGSRNRFAGERSDSVDRSPKAAGPDSPAPLRVPRERWYVEPTASSFSWKEPQYQEKMKEKPLPPLPPKR